MLYIDKNFILKIGFIFFLVWKNAGSDSTFLDHHTPPLLDLFIF